MKRQSTLKRRASTLAIAAVFSLSGVPLAAYAAGLGKVTVFSALGQPLRAEIELSATREELSTMKAGLAPPDAFKAAGLDYATVLLGIRFTVDKRASGQPVVKLSSDRPLNEPFVDMLVELNWGAGRLVREYTFLLDPPDVAAKAAPVVVPEARSPATKPAQTSASAPVVARAVAEPAIPPAPPAKPAPRPKAEVPAESKGEGADTYLVKSGDNLRKIASANQQEGVSLDQMLVGLFRANKEAFDGGNMNRLKSGKILTVPQKAELEAVSPGEAQKVVVAQAADWNAYRRKLAEGAAQSPAGGDAGRQQVSGKITAKVEDKVPPASEAKDQVRVSRTETGKGKPGARISEDELVAKENALKEANDRLAALEKNVSDLQKLLELKNQNLAELQKQAAKPAAPAAPATPAAATKPEPAKPVEAQQPVAAAKPAEPPQAVVEPPKPVEAPKAVESPKPAEPVEPPKTAEPPKAEEAKPAVEKKPEEAKPVEPPKPAAEAPPPRPKPVIPPPPPEEPGFFEELMDSPAMLAAGGGLLALIAGLIFYKRRRNSASGDQSLITSTAGLSQSSLSENSVFRSTGGQSVDTSHAPPMTDFSQTGPGIIDTDEVDPVAEADVYMAYGRDVQAEEILLEAKAKDPKRYAIHLKLLEIYANRKSAKQFETLASELYGETHGVGADWEKAASMGVKLDPKNPLYGGSQSAATPGLDGDAGTTAPAQTMRNTVTMPGQLAQMAAAAEQGEVSAPEPQPVEATPEPQEANDLSSLDFDLGAPENVEESAKEVARDAAKEAEAEKALMSTLALPEVPAPQADAEGVLDFNLETAVAPVAAPNNFDATMVNLDFGASQVKAGTPAAKAAEFDFDLGSDAASPKAAPAADRVSAPAAAAPDLVLDAGDVDTEGLEFDVQLTESTVLGQPMSPSSFDMTSIDLDLAETKVVPTPLASESNRQSNHESNHEPGYGASYESAQLETVVNPEPPAPAEPEISFEAIDVNEEVTTKLDLAKAYEEMGDLEGARELLQEVLKEGSAEQQAAARGVLERVGSS